MLDAAAIYRGDLLESLDVGAGFGRWVMAERERLRDMAQALLTRPADAPIRPKRARPRWPWRAACSPATRAATAR